MVTLKPGLDLILQNAHTRDELRPLYLAHFALGLPLEKGPSVELSWMAWLESGVMPTPKGLLFDEDPISRAHAVAALAIGGFGDAAHCLHPHVMPLAPLSSSSTSGVSFEHCIPHSPEDFGMAPWELPGLSLGKWSSTKADRYHGVAAARAALIRDQPEDAVRGALDCVYPRLRKDGSRRRSIEIKETGMLCRLLPKFPWDPRSMRDIASLFVGAVQEVPEHDMVLSLRTIMRMDSLMDMRNGLSVLSRAPTLAELRKLRGAKLVLLLWAMPWVFLQELVKTKLEALHALLLTADRSDIDKLRTCLQPHAQRVELCPDLNHDVPAKQALWTQEWFTRLETYSRRKLIWDVVRGSDFDLERRVIAVTAFIGRMTPLKYGGLGLPAGHAIRAFAATDPEVRSLLQDIEVADSLR